MIGKRGALGVRPTSAARRPLLYRRTVAVLAGAILVLVGFGGMFLFQRWSSAREYQAARQAYEKALAIQPNFAQAHRELGVIAMQKQDYASAAEHLAKATELGMESAQNYNFLGIAYSRTNRLTQAIAVYRKALQLDPQMAEAHLNLAYALQRHGDVSSAKGEYDAACKLDKKFCGAVKQ